MVESNDLGVSTFFWCVELAVVAGGGDICGYSNGDGRSSNARPVFWPQKVGHTNLKVDHLDKCRENEKQPCLG